MIDAMVEELVAERLGAILQSVRTIEESVERFEGYLR